MKYLINEKALVSMSDKDWKKYCEARAKGEEVQLPGNLLFFTIDSIDDITRWDREDFANAIGIEVPDDLPRTTKKLSARGTRRKS